MFSNIRHIWAVLSKMYGAYKWQVILLTILGFVSGVLDSLGIAALIPFFSLIIDRTSHTSDFITAMIERLFGFLHLNLNLWTLIGFVAVLFILKSVVKFTLAMVRTYVTSNYTLHLRVDLYRGVLGTSWPYLLNQKIGYLENVLMTDIGIAEKIFRNIATAVPMIATFIVYVFTAIKISPRISLAALAIGLCLVFLLKPLFTRTRVFRKQMVTLNKQITHIVNEHVHGIKTVKIMGVETSVVAKVTKKFKEIWRVGMKTALIIHLGKEPVEPVSILFMLLIFVFSYHGSNFQIGNFAAVIYLVQRIFSYIRDFFEMSQSVYQHMAHLFPVLDLQKDVVKHKESAGGDRAFAFEKEIAFQDVSFSYGDGGEVFTSFDIKVKKGEMIGLVGESGGGKTTLADLLLGLFTPQKGKVMIDGVSISDFAKTTLRTSIGYVSQDIFLRNDTIENNIRFYNDALNLPQIETAARQAHIYDVIEKLPRGFDTVVGERGVRLSGGQRQRIVLARVLARNPQILILDEATSALDNESEAEIKKTLIELRGVKTIIIIAHRLTTVMDCDRIFVLKNGEIAEEGDPKSLLSNSNSIFYKMQNANA